VASSGSWFYDAGFWESLERPLSAQTALDQSCSTGCLFGLL
jgi:hypothetical protein